MCGNAQNGRRSDLGKVTGQRRLQCGHHVTVKIARRYAQDPAYATADGQLTLFDQAA